MLLWLVKGEKGPPLCIAFDPSETILNALGEPIRHFVLYDADDPGDALKRAIGTAVPARA